MRGIASVHTRGQMLKESTVRKEEVTGLSDFCLFCADGRMGMAQKVFQEYDLYCKP